VLRNGGEGNIKRAGEFLDGGFSFGEAGEDGAARGVGESAEGEIEGGGRIVNHTVYYLAGPVRCQVV
jgi:hypothetical protein